MQKLSTHFADPLFSLTHFQPLSRITGEHVEAAFRDVDAALRPPFTPDAVRRVVEVLRRQYLVNRPDGAVYEEMQDALMKKVLLGLYANALDLFLFEASIAQEDAEWWTAVEQSSLSAAMYLVQTLSRRVWNVFGVLRSCPDSLHMSTFHPGSIVNLFHAKNHWQPSVFMSAFFPHLSANASSRLLPASQRICRVGHQRSEMTYLGYLTDILYRCISSCAAVAYLPFHLAREECRIKRIENEKIRNERAGTLGTLLAMRPDLSRLLKTRFSDGPTTLVFLTNFANTFSPVSRELSEHVDPSILDGLCDTIFFVQQDAHFLYLNRNNLRPPSKLTRLWPRLLILPPLTLYCLKMLYASRETLIDLVRDTLETSQYFLRDWLLEPLHGVYRTIRAGGEGVIVRPEAIAADLNSLERMSLALAHDKLGYDQIQLASLSQQIRLGDFTPVLQVYEEDIRSPLKSAITGSLLRSLFIQVQKAKVDIDQTLAGVDRLLKSQELTFAFVGVAPAFAVLYVAGSLVRRLLSNSRGKYGSRHKRQSVWLAMRRIERLLLFQPNLADNQVTDSAESRSSSDAVPSLTSGLLVLSLMYLRNYALTCLPVRSRLREGFLEDVADLEDPTLGRSEKMRVLDRMWRSWASELGWHRLGGGPKQ